MFTIDLCRQYLFFDSDNVRLNFAVYRARSKSLGKGLRCAAMLVASFKPDLSRVAEAAIF